MVFNPSTFASRKSNTMITCYIHYTINPLKVKAFATYASMWIPLVSKYGGIHHGYFLPYEGANNKAYALFSFSSLAAYEKYRLDSTLDIDCITAYQYAEKSGCIISYERSFVKPIFE